MFSYRLHDNRIGRYYTIHSIKVGWGMMFGFWAEDGAGRVGRMRWVVGELGNVVVFEMTHL